MANDKLFNFSILIQTFWFKLKLGTLLYINDKWAENEKKWNGKESMQLVENTCKCREYLQI